MSNRSLKAILDNIDDLEEQLAALYVPGSGDLEGRYVLGVEEVDGFGIANPGSAHGALEKERKSARAAQRAKSQLEKDLAAARERIAELEESMADGVPDAAGVEKAIRQKIEREYERKMQAAIDGKTGELQSLMGERDSFEKQVRKLLIDSIVDRGETDRFRYSPKVIGPHVRSRIAAERDEDSGEIVRRFLDASGQPGYKANGQPWDIDDLLHDIARDGDLGNLIARKDGQPPARGTAPRSPDSAPRQASGRRRHLTAEEMSDFRTYSRIVEEAARDGTELVPPTQS